MAETGVQELGLNEHHERELVNFLRFCRYQRSQKVRTVAACFQNARESRFPEPTYTADEVLEVLGEVEQEVRDEVEGELIHMTRTATVLLRSLFLQAQEWHLKLQADTAELENMEMLEKMKKFEEAEAAFGKDNSDPLKQATHKLGKLNPIADAGASKLLNTEIEKLADDNSELRSRVRMLEERANEALKEKTLLNQKLEKACKELESLRENQDSDCLRVSSELEDVKGELHKLKVTYEKGTEEEELVKTSLESDLKTTKLRLLAIQEMLDVKEKELEKKLNQTAAFASLKRILESKNKLIQDLRGKLKQLDPSAVDDGGAPVEED